MRERQPSQSDLPTGWIKLEKNPWQYCGNLHWDLCLGWKAVQLAAVIPRSSRWKISTSHFTGDFSAIEKTNNPLAAMINNPRAKQKRNLQIDPRSIVWKRVMDMNGPCVAAYSNRFRWHCQWHCTGRRVSTSHLRQRSWPYYTEQWCGRPGNKTGRYFYRHHRKRWAGFARDLNAVGAMAMLLQGCYQTQPRANTSRAIRAICMAVPCKHRTGHQFGAGHKMDYHWAIMV